MFTHVGLQSCGLPTHLMDVALDWNVVHEELTGGRVPSVIAGDFWYGNNSGVKLSLDRNCLRLLATKDS
jgi:cholesterol oxidase